MKKIKINWNGDKKIDIKIIKTPSKHSGKSKLSQDLFKEWKKIEHYD